MKYTYAVKVNGTWYQPNTEIPEKKVNSKKETTTATNSEKETVKK